MSHSYLIESESLRPESAPMALSAQTPIPAPSSTAGTAAVPLHPQPAPRVRSTKPHVPSACINCKKAHLACDLSRPCKRCVSVGKDDTCRDVEHKKRGRPKLVDKAIALDGAPKTASNAAVSALAKTRVKAKYTKTANYKLPKKATNGIKTLTENYAAPQTDVPAREVAMDSQHGQSSSYPSRHEHSRPTTPLSYRTPSTQEYRSRPVSLHSESSLAGDKDSYYYGSSAPSSTTQIKHPQEMYSAPSSAPMATVFLTMDLICARVSDESQSLWGYHPHNISNKSLYSIIAGEDHGKMGSMLGLMKDAVFSSASPNAPQHLSHFPFLESSSTVFYQNRPDIMSSSAPGSNEYTDVIRMCHADGSSDLFSVRMYIGGGLGTDLVRGLNLEHSYVVCTMARHEPPMMNERPSLEESRAPFHSVSPSSSKYLPPPTRYSPPEVHTPTEPRKISLPPIFTGTSTASSSALSSPSVPSPQSANSLNGRMPMPYGSSAPSGSPSYTVSLSKPSSHSTSLPPLRSGPLHTAGWLYDSEPFGVSGHSSQSPSSARLPTVFSDPFRSASAPMGGFGVSKYLSRPGPTPSFGNIRRHQLPLPSPLQSSSGSRLDASTRNPKSLQRDLSSSSFGTSFASRSPPQSMKRPLADMADSQDHTRDIDIRHQDHHQHQGTRTPLSSSASSSSSIPSSRGSFKPNMKLDLQAMPPDHPTVDSASSGVCPIVHGSQQRERVQQATRDFESKESRHHTKETERVPCQWAKVSDTWKDHGSTGHNNNYSPSITPDHLPRGHDHHDGKSSGSNGYFDYEGSSSSHRHSLGSGSHRYSHDGPSTLYSPHGEDSNRVNPFSTGPSSPVESYPHHRGAGALRRPSSVGRSPYSRNNGSVVCLSGACASVCRCSGEDEATRAVKAMDAARKRMSVHSLLC